MKTFTPEGWQPRPNPQNPKLMLEADCDHSGWTGVDRTPLDDPGKIWRCDGCGKRGTAAQLEVTR